MSFKHVNSIQQGRVLQDLFHHADNAMVSSLSKKLRYSHPLIILACLSKETLIERKLGGLDMKACQRGDCWQKKQMLTLSFPAPQPGGTGQKQPMIDPEEDILASIGGEVKEIGAERRW